MKAENFLVVGGTRGTGLHFVREAVDRGAHRVVVTGRREQPEFGEIAGSIDYRRVDLNDSAAVNSFCAGLIEEGTGPDHIVFFQRFRGNEPDSWEGEIAVSLSATRTIIESLNPLMATGDGEKSIVVIGSVAEQFVFPDQSAGYHVAKAGLKQLVRYYAAKLGPDGIRVNLVTPATILKEEARDFYDANPEILARKKAASPLGRVGTPQDVANAVFFLTSNAAGFITGTDLVVDGGISLLGHEYLSSKVDPGST